MAEPVTPGRPPAGRIPLRDDSTWLRLTTWEAGGGVTVTGCPYPVKPKVSVITGRAAAPAAVDPAAGSWAWVRSTVTCA